MTSPRFGRWLIRIAAPKDKLDELLGDFEEMHRRRRAAGQGHAVVVSVADAVIVSAVLGVTRLCSFCRGRFGAASCMRAGDLRSGLRLMRRTPVMTFTATAALALGIGLLAVGVATVEALLFSKLPFEGGDRFIVVRALQEPERRSVALAPEDYGRLAADASALEHLGAASQGRRNVALPSGRIESVVAAGITPSLLRFLPYQPIRGRPLIPTDAQPGAEPVLVIREAYWQRVFGGAQDAIGATIEVGGTAHTVVGIMPNEFEFPNSPPAFWTPIQELRGASAALPFNARIVGILARGRTIESAQAELDVLAGGVRAATGEAARIRLEAASMTELGPEAVVVASALVAAVVALLTVVAANVANLVLARSFLRTRELAVRAALGASRARLVGQLTAELLPLCFVAAGIGVLAAHAALRRFNAMEDLPFWATFSIGPRTLALVVIGALLATVLAAAWPALKVTRGGLGAALPSGTRTGDVSFGRVAGIIVIVQIAMSVVMLNGALVVADGAARYAGGTAALPDSVLTAGVYDAGTSSTAGAARWPEEIEGIASRLPGAIAVGLSTALPRQSPRAALIEIEPLAGQTPQPPRPAPSAEVSPGYFSALDADTLVGRLLTEQDADGGTVAVVNAPFVEKFLGGAYPIGRRFRAIGADGPGIWREIVGVVPDLGLSVGDPSLAGGYYTPLDPARQEQARFVYLAMRVSGDPLAYIDPLKQAIYERDPTVVLNQPQPLEDVAIEDRSFFVWFSTALTGIGIVTLILALMGVYSMMALIVAKRTREIGIRLALGATAHGIVGTVVGRAALQVAAGALVGAVLAVLSLDLRGVLVSSLPDGGAWTLPAVLTLLAVAGIAATALPLQRAVRVQPSDAMRSE